MKFKFLKFVLPALAAVASGGVYAAAVPDAGSLLQQIEQNQQPNIPHKDLQENLPEPAPLGEQRGVIVTVKSFRFVGNTLLTSEQLAPAVKGYLKWGIQLITVMLLLCNGIKGYILST